MTCLYPHCGNEASYIPIGLCGLHRKALTDSERSELWGYVNAQQAGRITAEAMRARQRETVTMASERLGVR